MDHRDKLLSIVQEKGPLLPSQINKELRTNVLFASAMLSEMVQSKKLKISSIRVGGSPLYYCEGQENSLEQFAEKLSEPDRSAFTLLKNSKILRDRDQEPYTRVALREIKDFAIPLEVNADNYSDLFWKYYLVSDQEAESLIKDYINAMEKNNELPARPEQPKAVPERPKEIQATISDVEHKDIIPAPITHPEPEHITQTPELEKEPEVVPQESGVLPQKPVTEVTMTQLDEKHVPEFSYRPAVSFSTAIDTDEQLTIDKEPEPEPEPELPEYPEDDEFFQKVSEFFSDSGIEILDFENIRTGTEYDFTIRIPSNVGHLKYYCKAKSKAKLNEGDLSTTFVYGQMKKLPILLLTVGDMTKKAEELLNSEFKNMFVKRID